MDNVTDRAARFGLDSFWLLRSRVIPGTDPAAAPHKEQEESESVLGRDWNEVSVRLGAVRWYAR